MTNNNKTILGRLLFPFIKLSGEDAYIVEKSTRSTKLKIGGIGLLVSIIMLLTFYTFYLTFYRLFDHKILISIVMSFFIGLIYFTLYQFLNYTLTKNVLPRIEEKVSFIQKNFSIFLRVGFIIFLAFIVGQLLMGATLGYTLSDEINDYRKERLEQFIELSQNISSSEDDQIDNYKSELDENYFFIKRLQLLESNPLSWLIILIVIIIFISPVALKLTIGDKFYNEKKRIQRTLIENHFKLFQIEYFKIMKGFENDFNLIIKEIEIRLKKENYVEIKTSKIDDEICIDVKNTEGVNSRFSIYNCFSNSFETKYQDSPYNTILKKKPSYRSEKEFINKYFN